MTQDVVAAANSGEPRTIERIVERVVERPMRRRLPDTRTSKTHKFNVAGHEGYLTVGLYDDGQPGELFITMAKEGSTIGGLMDSLGTAISVALQYGVPTASLVTKFSHQRFEPAGMTHNRDIPFAKSLVDYIFRWMGMEFVPGYREANAPQRSTPPTPTQAQAPAASIPVDMSAAVVGDSETAASRPASDRVKMTDFEAQAKGRSASMTDTSDTSDAADTSGNAWGFASGKSSNEKSSVASPTSPTSSSAEPGDLGGDRTSSTLTEAMSSMQADAPACDTCGTITVRNGTCYRCLNCGASMGCS